MKRETIFELATFFILVVIGVLTRYISGEYSELTNFTATGAAALFAGYYFRNWLAAPLVPLTIMGVSNFALEPYDSPIQAIVVYIAWMVPVLLGFALRGQEKRAWRIAGLAVVSAVSFFLITNFAGWACHNLYPKTFEGVISSYIAGIPFFRNTLASELLFAAVLFGTHAVAVRTGILPWAPRQTVFAPGIRQSA